jgi:hypothetical protein
MNLSQDWYKIFKHTGGVSTQGKLVPVIESEWKLLGYVSKYMEGLVGTYQRTHWCLEGLFQNGVLAA